MERSFRRENASLEAIVDFVREFTSEECLGDSLAFDMDLVLEELFTNQVKYGGAAHGDITIRLERAGHGVVMTILDYDAQPFDPTLAPQANVARTVEEYRPGGLGIHFVRQLSERFDYEYRDRVCTITVTLREPQ
jgi:anti-sigma regulatory factor (Ser/Thr protein kinase)